MPQIIAPGTTATQSADFTLAAFEEAHISIFGTSTPDVPIVRVQLLKQASSGVYVQLGELTEFNRAQVIRGAGVWAIRRLVCSQNVGVDRD